MRSSWIAMLTMYEVTEDLNFGDHYFECPYFAGMGPSPISWNTFSTYFRDFSITERDFEAMEMDLERVRAELEQMEQDGDYNDEEHYHLGVEVDQLSCLVAAAKQPCLGKFLRGKTTGFKVVEPGYRAVCKDLGISRSFSEIFSTRGFKNGLEEYNLLLGSVHPDLSEVLRRFGLGAMTLFMFESFKEDGSDDFKHLPFLGRHFRGFNCKGRDPEGHELLKSVADILMRHFPDHLE